MGNQAFHENKINEINQNGSPNYNNWDNINPLQYQSPHDTMGIPQSQGNEPLNGQLPYVYNHPVNAALRPQGNNPLPTMSGTELHVYKVF